MGLVPWFPQKDSVVESVCCFTLDVVLMVLKTFFWTVVSIEQRPSSA